MQTLSSYLLETRPLDNADAEHRVNAVISEIAEWLRTKGSADPSSISGTFQSLTADGNGRYARDQLQCDQGFLEETRLEEFSRAGQTFTTRVAVARWSNKVYVYVTLTVANTVSVIAPIQTDPRCPSIVRTLLGLFSDWMLNGTVISSARPWLLFGAAGGRQLADEIRDSTRTLPLVVVSHIEGETLWPKLADDLAYDLVGLTRVITIDDDASWTLSDRLGKLNSCYQGAIRLYWPPQKRSDGVNHFNSTVWTASALLSNDHDGRGLIRFKSELRRTVMSTAALTITPPAAIRAIQDAIANKRLAELESKSTSNSEELQIARLYIHENQTLKAQIEQMQSELAQMSGRAETAEYALTQLKARPCNEAAKETFVESDASPAADELRFYKKQHSKGAYDVLVRVSDCGHTSWQSSAKADKARKGLERLEGRRDWKSMLHCGTCTGGGMWKVRW